MRHLAKKNPAGADAASIFSCSLSNCHRTETKTDQSMGCLLCDLKNNNNESGSEKKKSSAHCCPINTSNLNK